MVLLGLINLTTGRLRSRDDLRYLRHMVKGSS